MASFLRAVLFDGMTDRRHRPSTRGSRSRDRHYAVAGEANKIISTRKMMTKGGNKWNWIKVNGGATKGVEWREVEADKKRGEKERRRGRKAKDKAGRSDVGGAARDFRASGRPKLNHSRSLCITKSMAKYMGLFVVQLQGGSASRLTCPVTCNALILCTTVHYY